MGSVALADAATVSVSYATPTPAQRPRVIDFKGYHIEKDIILTCVRWYPAYPLSYRNLAEMMAERGVTVDPSNVYRWVQKFTPQLVVRSINTLTY